MWDKLKKGYCSCYSRALVQSTLERQFGGFEVCKKDIKGGLVDVTQKNRRNPSECMREGECLELKGS